MNDCASEVKIKAISGVIWKFLERIIAQSVSLMVSIIIARILSPDDYSVVSIVTIFFTFSNVLISGGLNTALIQKKNADEIDYSTVFFTSFAIALILYIVLFVMAPYIASVYNKPILIPVIRVMSVTLPINAIKSIVCAYISATLQFKKFFFATISGTIASAVVGVLMAVYGFGVWALVAQQMTNATIDTLILYLSTHLKFRPVVSFQRLSSLWKYGWKVLLSSLIGTAYMEINPLFIGLRFSTSDLSFYEKGRSFPSLISSTTTNTLSAVLFPFLSKFQDDKDGLLKYTRKYISVTSYVVFPLMIGLCAVGDKFIELLLTDKWIDAVPYLRIFCVASMFDMINIGNCETIKAMGRSDIFLIMEIIKKAGYFLVIGMFLLFSDSPVILACSSLFCTVIAITVNSIPNKHLIAYSYKYQAQDLALNLISSLIMGGIVLCLGFCIPLETFPLLLVQILSGVIIYLLLSLLCKNKNMYLILEILLQYIKR